MRFLSVRCPGAPGVTTVVLALSLRLLVEGVAVADAQQLEFKLTNDPRVISANARLALPNAQRALELLTSANDADSLAVVADATWLSYKYLRSAQESIERILRHAKYPDPLLALHKDQMWQVRLHLLRCLDNRGHLLAQQPQAIATCTEHLAAGVAKLESLLVTLP